jgi:anti-anti-sigma factor
VDEWTVVSDADGRVAASVQGDIDLANAPQLIAHLKALICGPGQRIEVDLSGVEFMDSSGLAALIAAQRVAVDRGSPLILVATSPQVERLLEITGCRHLFAVTPADNTPLGESSRFAGRPAPSRPVTHGSGST